MVDLNGHEAGNGGYSQGTPTAHRAPASLLLGEMSVIPLHVQVKMVRLATTQRLLVPSVAPEERLRLPLRPRGRIGRFEE
jgi:hypothetical protein